MRSVSILVLDKLHSIFKPYDKTLKSIILQHDMFICVISNPLNFLLKHVKFSLKI